MKNILLLANFTELDRNAAEHAIKLFSRHDDVRFTLMNVYTEPISQDDLLFSITDLLESQSKEKLKEEYNYLISKFPAQASKIKQRSELGNLGDVLERIVNEGEVSFVVMGTDINMDVENELTKANLIEVIKKVKAPILAVPKESKYKTPERIALEVHHESLDNQMGLEPLFDLARCNRSELLIINSGTEEIIEAEDLPRVFFNVTRNRSRAKSLNEFAIENEVDMLSVIVKRSEYEGQFDYNFKQQLLFHSKFPLLILNYNESEG